MLNVELEALEICSEALDVEPAERAAFVAARCEHEPELRTAVESLLQRDEEAGASELDRLLESVGTRARCTLEHVRRPLPSLPARVGRYVVEEELGAGSMGVVYRARQDQPRRDIALKLLIRGLETEADRQRFAIETEALALLRHPGIAHLYDAGVVAIDGCRLPFLAMELVEGIPLLAWARTLRPGIEEKLALLIAIGEAVDAAHRRGVVHRDLKPSNILVELDEGRARPRILDFGVARIAADQTATSDPAAAQIVGTLSYMSPEQAAGSSAIDGRADLYSLGVIAYELLVGALPIPSAEEPLSAALQRIAHEVPLHLSHHDSVCGGDLELVVARALAKDPDARYASAREFAADLQRILDRRAISIRKPTAAYLFACFARRQPAACAITILAGLAFLVALPLSWFLLARAEADRDRVIEEVVFVIDRVIEPMAQNAGTAEACASMLGRLAESVEECLLRKPGDPHVLACHDRILRILGDLAVKQEHWTSALELRLQSLALREALRDLRSGDPLELAEWATATVRVGDAEQRLLGRDAALARYSQAHQVFASLAQDHPKDGRHVDDLAWSCDRMADLAIKSGALDLASGYLERRRELLERLQELRPGSPTTLAGERAYWCLRSQLEGVRGAKEKQLRFVWRSLRPARERCRLEPGSAQAVIELASSMASFAGLAGKHPLHCDWTERFLEARGMLQRLIAQDPDDRMARAIDAEFERLIAAPR